ncbi:putative reverse transcriptase domain-containing protein [Tanacetum coccineum]
MSASRQGMGFEEMEQVVAQRVANAIEAITIYESKICMAHDSMNQVVREEATIGKNVSNKRKWGSDHGRDSDQQQSKRIEVVRAHATGVGNKKANARILPYCNRCKLHHTGPCNVKCGNCKRVGHMKKYCRTSAPATIKRAPIANQKPAVTYFGCGAQGHFKSKCLRLKNQMYDNQKKEGGEKSVRTLRKFGDSQLTGPEIVNETTETKKSYADMRRKPLEFQVGVKGMIKMSPKRGQSLNAAAIKQLITQRVNDAMAAYEANQNNRNRDGNPHVNVGGVVPVARECTYQDFVKCQALNFKGTEGVVGLTRWFEKMETVFHISNYAQNCQVKYASCTLHDSALTWWNSHKRIIGTDASYAMTWKALMKLMTEKLKGYTARNADNKRRFDNDPRDNRVQQPPLKRQNVARAYTVGNNKNKGYAGNLPLCDKCKLHHHGLCPVRCENCKKVGHQARDYWASTTMTCYGCRGKGHTKRYFPELGNQNGDEEAHQNLDIVMGTSLPENSLHSYIN